MAKATQAKSARKKGSYHHGDLRATLITTALALIEEHGTKGFSLKDAARIAGVSIAAPYRHFTDKEALLRAIQDEGFSIFNDALASAYASAASPREKLEELGVAYVNFAIAHPAHFQVMFGMRLWDTPGPEDQNGEGFALLVEAVAKLHPEATPEVRMDHVLGAWSLVHGFAMLQMEGSFAGTVVMGDVEAQLRRTLRLTIANPQERTKP